MFEVSIDDLGELDNSTSESKINYLDIEEPVHDSQNSDFIPVEKSKI